MCHPHVSADPSLCAFSQVRTPPEWHSLGLWTHAEGLVLDQLANGVDAASGQLSPGLWLDTCSQDGKSTPRGWTAPYLRKFLSFLDEKGVRSVDIWTGNLTANGAGCQAPCPASPSCDWVYHELHAWKTRNQTTNDAPAVKSDDDRSSGGATAAVLVFPAGQIPSLTFIPSSADGGNGTLLAFSQSAGPRFGKPATPGCTSGVAHACDLGLRRSTDVGATWSNATFPALEATGK